MSDQKDQIARVWQFVYDVLRGPGRNHTYNSFLNLHPRFEEDLLNEISELGSIHQSGFTQKVEEVRAKAGVAQATGLLGTQDLERINVELDQLTQGE